MCMNIHVCVYICVWVRVYMCVSMCVYVHVGIYLCVSRYYAYACTQIAVYVCVCLSACVHRMTVDDDLVSFSISLLMCSTLKEVYGGRDRGGL